MGIYELKFCTEYEGILFNGSITSNEKKLLAKKIMNDLLNQIDPPSTITIKELQFIALKEVKKTTLTGIINLKYDKFIPLYFTYPIIFEVVNEILGYLMLAGKQNGVLSSSVKVNEPTVEVLFTNNPDPSLNNFESLLKGVRTTNVIDISKKNTIISFENYLSRSENEAIKTAQFWLYVANSHITNEGVSIFDDIKRFTSIWSAFNSLYNLQEDARSDREKVTSMVTSNKKIKEYVNDFLTNQKDRLNNLLNLNLTPDKGRWSGKNLTILYNNASFNSTNITGNKDYYFMLILYTLRNNTVHGNGYFEIISGARVASDFLEGMVKVIIQQRILNI